MRKKKRGKKMTKKLLEGFAKDQLFGFWKVFIFKGMLSIKGQLISEAEASNLPKSKRNFSKDFCPSL